MTLYQFTLHLVSAHWAAVVRICVWAALVTSIVQKHELLAHCVYVQAVEMCTLCLIHSVYLPRLLSQGGATDAVANVT